MNLEREFIKETGQELRFTVWKRDRKYFNLRTDLKYAKSEKDGGKKK